MLSNSVIAGGVAAAYLVVLVLQLNPSPLLAASSTWWLMGVIWAGYGVNLSALFYALIVAQQVLSTEALSPGWFSVRLLALLLAGAAAAGAALMWLNLAGLRATLDAEAARRMTVGASVLTGCAAAFVVVAVLHVSIGRRGGRLGGLAVLLLMVASLGLPLAARGKGYEAAPGGRRVEMRGFPPAQDTGTRVFLLGLDGASLDIISPAAADGRLPNFGRMLDGGAAVHLATLRPTQPGPVWAAVATGKLPFKNGVRSAATYAAGAGDQSVDLLPDFCFAHGLVRAGLLSETTQTSAAFQAQPVWAILSRAGLSSAVVRWPLTWPAQPLLGELVTDQYQRASDLSVALDEPGLTYPTALALDLRREPEGAPPGGTPVPAGMRGADYPGEAPLALDRAYVSIADRLESLGPAAFSALRLEGIDTVGHYFLRQALPRAFGDVSDEERRIYGQVLEQYYRYVDGEIGRLLDRLGPRDVLLVISPFGIEPLSPAKRLLEHSLGNAALSGTHERAPDGFLLTYGAHVRAGRLPRGSVVDVTPTLLYFLGLPVGRDMDGFARTDIFTGDFTADRPIAYIPTYER
jgi:Type I phosphodiesterase / nucleotide pyrophosphatase